MDTNLDSLKTMDDVASMLAGVDLNDEATSENKEQSEEEQSEEEQSEEELRIGESEDGQPSNESETNGDGSEQADSEVSWGSVLGIDDSLVTLDDSGNFKGIKTKVDGVEEVIGIKDLVSGYQTNKYNTQKSQALTEEFKQFQESKKVMSDAYEERISDVTKVLEYTKAQFLREYQGINWEALRNNNPAEYAALLQDFNIKNNEFDSVLSKLSEIKQQEQKEKQKELNTLIQQRNKEQLEITLRNNPEWQDSKVMKTAITSLADFIGENYGFSKEEFMSINDARIIEVLKDAYNFRNNKKLAEEKIVKSVPKFQKVTGNKKSNVTQLDRLVKRAKNIQGYAKRGAQVDAITQLLLDENVKVN